MGFFYLRRMKKIILSGLLLSLFACGSSGEIKEVDANAASQSGVSNVSTASASSSTSSSTPSSQPVKQIVKSADVKKHLIYLASDELQGRATGSEGIEKAAEYITKQFEKSGIKPYFSTYRDDFDAKGKKGFNIVGMIPGTDPQLKDEFVIIGAHYDHIGTAKAVEGDTIANGANDDASGTTAVIELAKYFAKAKNNKRSMIFTLYAGEEMGLLGSKHLAQRLKDEGLDLYTMFNIEMMGVPMQNKDFLVYLTGYNNSNMADKFNEYSGRKVMGFLPQAQQYNLFKRSDNYSFYEAFKMPAQTVSSFDFTNFDYYHKVGDEADKMDFEFMAKVINNLIPGVEGMVNSAEQEIEWNE